MKHAARLFVVTALSCGASSAAAADAPGDYPNRPIRFIAPFVAGGPIKGVAREYERGDFVRIQSTMLHSPVSDR